MKHNIKAIMTLTVLAVFGFSTIVFAGWGSGYGHMMGPNGSGSGGHHRGGYGYDQGGYYDNLSDEEIAKFDNQRADFFKATERTRRQLYEKELALQSELAKENPDIGNASKLQGEISKLQSDIDQKRLDYEIKARKSEPNYNRGYGGYGRMMDNGPRGGGYCMY